MLAAALGAALAALDGLEPPPTRLAPSGVFLTAGVAVLGAALAALDGPGPPPTQWAPSGVFLMAGVSA
eukprot:8977484-Alexandrium_andersonii.AAC.1